MGLLVPAAGGDPRVPPHRGAVPEPWLGVLLEREKGCSRAGERACGCSPLGWALAPAHPLGEAVNPCWPTGEDGVMGLGQARSGTSQPSSSSAASFAGGRYGHGYRHSLQLKARSSRKAELFEQSPFQSVLPSLRVLEIYFSSKQESQSFPLRFLACTTPEKRALGLAGSQPLINLRRPDGL